MSRRVSTTQLKALLENIEQAASVDHPLSAMFRGMMKDALLDLRDLTGEADVLETRLDYATKALDEIVKELTKVNMSTDNMRYYIAHHIDWGKARSIDADALYKMAIKPLTGKEK